MDIIYFNNSMFPLGVLQRDSNELSAIFLTVRFPENQTIRWYCLPLPGLIQQFPRFIKQRTPEWHKLRDDGALSSSLTGAALGFWGNKDAFDLQKKFLYKVGFRTFENRECLIIDRLFISALTFQQLTSNSLAAPYYS